MSEAAVVSVNQDLQKQVQDSNSNSYFDAGLLGMIGTNILCFVITVFTFGLLYPLAVAIKLNFETRHTVIDGHRLRFTGSGMGLFGTYIKWWCLCIITVGIYTFWLVKKMNQWKAKHTHFNN